MEREKVRDRTIDILNSWVSAGVVVRLFLTVTIIAACVWLAAHVFAMAVWINSLLTEKLP